MKCHIEHVATAEIVLGVRAPIMDLAGYWIVRDDYSDAIGPFDTHMEASLCAAQYQSV